MNVRSICLAILYGGDRTGYDIRKFSTEGEFSFFVDASFGSIYPALNRLESEGLVTCRHEAQNGKPARKVYSITEAGREALMQDLLQPHQRDIFRSEFLVVAIFARLVGPEAIEVAIERQMAYLQHELDLIGNCDAAANQPEVDFGAHPEIEALHDAANWAQDYGRYCISANIAYLKERGVELVEIARKGPPPKAVSHGGFGQKIQASVN